MPEVERVDVPPGRHHPYWRYMCPHCGTHWEMEEKCTDFRQVCKDCVLAFLGTVVLMDGSRRTQNE